ncbi:MAG: Gfo/Idh/MocA family oxidoreductase [Caldilineaceae bacterium]|nr:Gfo/Idh/MocA family oxidoreductase [Caldilineaceae bacterium]
MLNVAVVGIGNIGQNHSRIYQAHPDTELVAVVDVVAAAAAAGGERFGVPHFTSIPDLLASDVHVDMASVCTAGKENGGDHYEPTMALLGAGIPVLGEKPISNELPKAREMVALARERNLRYGINLNHRFTPAALRAKEWVDAGRLGELNIINMTMWINNPNETSEHFHMRALHPHSLDVMRYFAGDVEKVQAFFKKGKGRAIWSNVQVNLLFRNGVIGHLTGSYDAGGSFGLETLEVVGSDGRFVLREACQHLEFYPRRSMETESYAYLGGMMAFPETFDSRIARWIEQNKADAAPEDIDASGEDALRVQTIIEGAIESWHTGKVVSV